MDTSRTAAPDRATPLVRKLGAFVRLSSAELDRLERLQAHPRSYKARVELLHETQVGSKAYILQDGWAMSYKLLPDGGRQVVDFQIPGDFLGLRSLLLRTSDHSAAAVTDIVACEIGAAALTGTFESLPRLGMAMLWAASRDEAMVVEHLTSIGRRNPIARTAHYFLELRQRLQLVGLALEDGFRCPLNQYLLADALGLSAIHLNRTLRQLRERGLMTLRAGRVTIHDDAALRAFAEFENGYLDQGTLPPAR
jgi:CRP-like cAMP-binding protein